ncbi:MAG: pitrilysin family protein [Victivallales bacterium]
MSITLSSTAAEKPEIRGIRSETLDNGLKIFVYENHEAPTVNLQVWVKTGSIHEGDYLGCGLSHFLEHMMFQGSAKYPHDSIVDTVNLNGGDMNAYTSLGNTVYYIDILSEASEKAIDILCDVVSAPNFPEDSFANEKEVILRERAMSSDNPERQLSEKLWLDMFLSHPTRHPIIGYGDKIKTVDKAMMLDYYRKRYSPERIFFVISGDIQAEKAFLLIRERLSGWNRGQLNDPPLQSESEQVCTRKTTYHFDDPLARIAVGFHIPDASHEDVPALDVLASILGSDKSSRLISRLQDEKHLAINIDAFSYTPYFSGVFGISATTSPDKLDALRAAIFAEIKKISSEDKITNDELKRVVNQVSTSYCRTMRSNGNISRMIGNSVLTYGTTEYINKYIVNVSALTTDDLTRVAEKYLTEKNCTIVEQLPKDKTDNAGPKEKAAAESQVPELIKLKAGQKIITFKDTKLPLVDICLILPGGVIREDKDNAGITRIMASMLTAGTKTYSEKELAALIDDNAIDLGINGGNNSVTISLNCHKNSLKPALEALKSILTEPSFPEKQFEREKENTIKMLASRKLAPQNAAEDKTCELLYRNHPYSHTAAGLEGSVNKITVGQVEDFYFKKCLIADKAIFGVAGDFDKEEILKSINDIIANIKWNEKGKDVLPAHPVFPDKKIRESVKVPREQAVVLLSFPICDNNNEDRFLLNVLSKILNGQSSRLFKSVREESGLAYYTGISTFLGIHEGYMSFYAGTRPDAVDKVISLLDKERRLLLKAKSVTKDEFESAVARIREDLAEQKLDKHSLIFNSALDEYYGNGYMSPWTNEKIFTELKIEDLNAVIKKYFDTDAYVTVISGPQD